MEECIAHQDNQSAMLLEKNGHTSAGKCSRHCNVKPFYIADLIQKGLLSIEGCPTDQMMADYHTKPLQGSKGEEQRKTIMNCFQRGVI